jgi:steroid 5-alpha reductase family enzyme
MQIAVLALALIWAASQGGAIHRGLPVFACCAALIFSIQWLAFVPAYLKQTETFYDLTGSVTYISATFLALYLVGDPNPVSLLIAACVLLWALRLGSFLFRRIREDGGDTRFEKIKTRPLSFFIAWNLQALWVLVTGGSALAAMSSSSEEKLPVLVGLGFFLWLVGFAWEVIADKQKRAHRRRAGADQFISTGLWAYCRHPNYFGEVLLWSGVAIMALPALQGWQYATLVSPLFVYILLTRISGVPLLEQKAQQRWGDQPDYQQYRATIPNMLPRLVKTGENPS